MSVIYVWIVLLSIVDILLLVIDVWIEFQYMFDRLLLGIDRKNNRLIDVWIDV